MTEQRTKKSQQIPFDQIPVTRARPARRILVRGDVGEHWVLRPTLMTDVNAILDGFDASVDEVVAFMPWAHRTQDTLMQLERLRDAEANYFAGRELTMALFRLEDGVERFACMVGLHPRMPLNPTGLEVGYWTPTPMTRKGITTFAVKLIVTYAFRKLGAERVQAICDEANVASWRVMQKVGMVREGLLRNMTKAPEPELVVGGFVHSGASLMYALTPEDFVSLPWVADIEARMTYENIVGCVIA